MTYLYLKSAVVILAITFSLHLLLRAHWIATVGMHSVFPGGILWDKLRIGPVQRELEMRRYGSTEASIDRADNRATILFGIGVMLASNLLLISVLCVGIFALLAAIIRAIGLEADIGRLFTWCLLGVVVPPLLAGIVDRRFGAHLAAGGHLRRALGWLLGLYGRLGLLSRSSNPVFSLLSSHGGERRALASTMAIMFVVLLAVLVSLASMRKPSVLGEYAMFPAFSNGLHTLDDAHYDDQRNPARNSAVAFIKSAIVTGPYLRLTIPLQPQDDARRACPAASGLKDDQRASALFGCLQRIYAVELDGKPMLSLPYDLGSDPRTDRPALVAMIDVRALAPGRHELQVAHPVEERDEPDKAGDDAIAPWRIPFWR